MKKILILTVTAGNGHNACASTIDKKLKTFPNVESKIIDIFKSFSNKQTFWAIDSGYNISVSKFLPIYNFVYEHYRHKKPAKRFSSPAHKFALKCVGGLLKEIYSYKPDVIFCTHFLASIAICDLKLKYSIPCKTYTTCLDYVLSPFWECCNTIDYFNIPNEDFISSCNRLGFSNNQILSFGIPVSEKFLKEEQKENLLKDLQLKPNTLTILVMFGGGHWNGSYKALKNLIRALKNKDSQVIVINGKNKKTFNQISKLKTPKNIHISNIGYTNNVEKYMTVSDICYTKVGGVSSTEMLYKNLPIFAIKKLPMQEKHNLEYLSSKGLAFKIKTKKDIQKNIEIVFSNNSTHINENNIIKKDALQNIVKHILSCNKANYTNIFPENINYNLVKSVIEKLIKKYKRERENLPRP